MVKLAETLQERIARHPFLSMIPARHLPLLAEFAMEVSYNAGETIFRQGDPANRFYLLESGQVELVASNGRPVVVQVIGSGDVLGWSWLFPPYQWQFGAKAVTPVRAVFLYGSRLREICEVNTDLGFHLMKATAAVLVNRLQSTRRELVRQAPPKEIV